MLGFRVGFISSQLTVGNLFPVNPGMITGPPKMSFLLEAKSMPALIIKPRLILLMHTDDLVWFITSNQQGQLFVQNRNRIVSKPNVTPGQIQGLGRSRTAPWHKQHFNWLYVPRKLSYSHISLKPLELSKWLPSERSDLSYPSVLQQQHVLYVRNISHQKVKYSTPCMCWTDNQLIATGDSGKSKGFNSMIVRGRRTKQSCAKALAVRASE